MSNKSCFDKAMSKWVRKKRKIPDYDLANLDPKTTFRWNLGRNRLENAILTFRKCPKIDENGPEWGRGESPRFDEDGATGCLMPLEPFPTPSGVVFKLF